MTLNPTTTLRAIRAHSPCSSGWATGLRALGPDIDAPISLGDIATSNGASDAMWCIPALDWSDILVRRAVLGGAVLPAVKRAHRHAHGDKPEPGYLVDLTKWCAGDDGVDISNVWDQARKAWRPSASVAANASDAAYAAIAAAATTGAYAAPIAIAAAIGAAIGAAAIGAAERAQQHADIIAAFPCVRLVGATP